ncbi:flagellar basal body P-ring formation chaperone FlgA [Methylobacterium radiodurans]|uniref:Flagella basal body P-ring formation protein FlgA n=1 Tax=Methylobacterium radiodurans TaxID=2202828 RepID=A0A2U8VYS4_9HYPH|nr:flagellar basal body P-ring formation chaperone FlgA [Methylobacterium radiodurans]AWN38947.1 flagella basal body P-ring formation protein FlgA [Methylobacterium radiodurans]
MRFAVVLRAGLAFAALAMVGVYALPALADAPMRLRGDVTARGDVLTLGDLVENAPEAAAARPLFRAPALGATGTIQARRIIDAAATAGLGPVETGGRVQVSVQRAARRVTPAEIEAALKRGLETGFALDAKMLNVRLDGEAPVLLAPTDLDGQVAALDLTYEPRTRRFAALISLGERQASLRVTGVAVELREVAILTRAVTRGERLSDTDFALERRPREGAPQDALAQPAIGEVAQRALGAGTVLRTGDTAPPELVARGEMVTILYEAPGITLSMRGIASEPGRLGAVVTVVNAVSKKVLQAIVVGQGRVSVGPAAPQRQASAALPGPTALR